MTHEPKTLQDLETFWTKHGGHTLGIAGSMETHCDGYHLGKDRIFGPCACKPKPEFKCVAGKKGGDYSVQHERDRNSLSDDASAIDLGKLDGSLPNLQKFSNWLVEQCMANKPGTSDIREVIYSPDGKRVLGYKEGIDFLIPDYGDDTHLTHTHISFFRDSVKRDKRPIFAPFFEEMDMPGLRVASPESVAGTVTVKDIAGVEARQIADNQSFGMLPGSKKRAFLKGRLLDDPLGKDSPGNDRHTVFVVGEELAVILAGQVDFEPDA